ncbi:MurR/RpiR family transcriptional regulator [Priestia flexa]|uniref:MurR/RpiR family transcriptional regulator n=1 Tax=Priestia flexa TaxID=86664 RepID=UPI002E1A196D|nr:MurR/RpiR family transcriptional regulator [Priestia flexa]
MSAQRFEQVVKEAFPHLSSGQKKVAQYLLDSLQEASFQTAAEIGRASGVSETTVIRLSSSLGFQSFSQMHDAIQQRVMGHEKTVKKEENQDVLKRVLESELNIICRLENEENTQRIWEVVDRLIHADQVLVAGYRTSYGAAHWFSMMLSTLRERVRLVNQPGDIQESLCDLTPESVIVVLSFPRYAKEATKLAAYAKKVGVTVIAVTDRILSPVGELADITLLTDTNVQSGCNSIAPVITLLDLVLTAYQEKNPAGVQQRQQKLESLYTHQDTYME